jgi:hypothetical protein
MSPRARWEAALGSRRDVAFHSYPALNHLFVAGAGPANPAEYQVPGHIAEKVVSDRGVDPGRAGQKLSPLIRSWTTRATIASEPRELHPSAHRTRAGDPGRSEPAVCPP